MNESSSSSSSSSSKPSNITRTMMMRHAAPKSLLVRTCCSRSSQRVLVIPRRNFASSSKESPEEMADRFVRNDVSGRISGTEALESVPLATKARNAAMASLLVGFVTGVWWYSMNAVGAADQVTFELEAQEARERALLQAAKEKEHANLVNMEMGVADQDKGDDSITVAVAAPDGVAAEEEAKNRALLKKKDSRPLWKRVVFFWRVA